MHKSENITHQLTGKTNSKLAIRINIYKKHFSWGLITARL